MVGEKRLPGILSININGDLDDESLIERAEKCKIVWVGYNPNFRDPFQIADLISDYVSFVGFGVVPVDYNCSKILENFREVVKRHRDTVFALGVGAGSLRGYEGLKKVIDCLKILRRYVDFLFCGCSGPKITRESSKIVDGILFNYAHPEHLKWIVRFVEREIIKVAYAPSLILPSEFEKDLLLACAIVACSNAFVKRYNKIEDLSRINFTEAIKDYKKFGKIPKVIEKHRDFLIEKFAISGKFDDFVEKVRKILEICDHVVLGDPFFRDLNQINIITHINSLLSRQK